MYSFAQRKDTKVFDEPLYGYYLSHSLAKKYHPGAEDIISTMENDGQKVVDMMMTENVKPVLFFKQMTHQLLDLDRSFIKKTMNIILTRDPKEMLPSFDKVIHNPTIHDVGYKLHIDLLDYFKMNNINYCVLDSKKVLLNPEVVLKKLCKNIGIPFKKNMLNWKKGSRPEDGIWAKYWYGNIHKSTGFIEYKRKAEQFPEHLKPLLQECLPLYNRLLKQAIG
ncbi:MAG: sulfotransferase family protein [Bacteroidetes bacterium]|nr:MAG: sulfotransferase family protein [Bacteroidota bacterium]